jgi:hypothetical protein
VGGQDELQDGTTPGWARCTDGNLDPGWRYQSARDEPGTRHREHEEQEKIGREGRGGEDDSLE